MGLKEEKGFKNHISLQKVSDEREQYVSGQLFELGDEVIIKETNQVATIAVLGSNYVIIEHHDGSRARKWLNAIEPIKEKTLTPNELKKRDKVAKAIKRDNPNMPMDKKMAIATSVAKKATEETQYNPQKMEWGTDESDRWARQRTPGQKEEKKPSLSMVDLAKARIDREKRRDAKKHDLALDRARLKDTRKKTAQTTGERP